MNLQKAIKTFRRCSETIDPIEEDNHYRRQMEEDVRRITGLEKILPQEGEVAHVFNPFYEDASFYTELSYRGLARYDKAIHLENSQWCIKLEDNQTQESNMLFMKQPNEWIDTRNGNRFHTNNGNIYMNDICLISDEDLQDIKKLGDLDMEKALYVFISEEMNNRLYTKDYFIKEIARLCIHKSQTLIEFIKDY